MPKLEVIKKEAIKEVKASDVYEWFKGIRRNGRSKIVATESAMELINMSLNDPEFDGFRFIDTMITYQSALNNDRVGLEDYINAIRFCSFLEVSEGNATEAYIRAFSHREFVKNRVGFSADSPEGKQLSSAAIRYRKNPLVINILTQAEVPLYLMFQGYRYKAVRVLVDEMQHAKLNRDRINAADKLLFHLKPPDNIKVELDIGMKKDDVVTKYEDMLVAMVAEQKKLLQNGESLDKVANARINYTEAEVIDEKV